MCQPEGCSLSSKGCVDPEEIFKTNDTRKSWLCDVRIFHAAVETAGWNVESLKKGSEEANVLVQAKEAEGVTAEVEKKRSS